LDKNFLITILAEAIEQSKGDPGRNEYLLKRINENKEIFNSDKLYLERISGLKIPDKTDNKRQQILEEDKSVFPILDLVKCATCNKEIKMDEKSARHRNFWYHETCYKTISEKKHKQEKIKIEKGQKNINLKTTTQKLEEKSDKIISEIPKVEPVEIQKVSKAGFFEIKSNKQKKQTKETSKDETKQVGPKIKRDPIIALIAGTIFVFIFIGPFYFLSGFSAGAMILGGALVAYQMWDAKRWSKSDFRSRKHAPGIFSVLLLVLPFAFGGLLAFEGYSVWESAYRSMILWGFTITFWSVMLMIPLALYSKNKEDHMKLPHKFPLITVLIPAYNEEKVIAKTIESTLEIDYPKKEIIVIDDGSKDNTLLIAKQYEKKGIKVLHKENGGKASALNYGTSFARGEFLAILDADTIAGRSSLKESIKVFEDDSNVGGVAGNIKIRNKVNWITWCQALEYIVGLQITRRAFDMFGAITIVPGALGLFKTSVLKEAGMYDKATLVEDFDATVKVLKSGRTVRGTAKSLAYTEAPESLTGFIRQRKRWYRGNLQVLFRHKDALFNPRFGFLQKIAYPYMVITMLILPITGFIMLASVILAIIEGDLLFVAGSMAFFIILQYLMTSLAVRMDGDDPKIIFFAIFSIFGFKQLQDGLLLQQMFGQLFKRKAKWTSVERVGFNE